MSDEKSFEATQSRIDKAKREGTVARSHDLGALLAFVGALAGTAAVAHPLAQEAAEAIRAASAHRGSALTLATLLALGCIPASCAAGAGIAFSLAQSGGVRFGSISANFSRMNPGEGLKRMFSREALVTALRAAVALLFAACAIASTFPMFYSAAPSGGRSAAFGALAWSGAWREVWAIAAVGALFAGIDYAMQRGIWKKKLRMSADELKRDHKEQEGDPLARGRRRAAHRRLSRGPIARVREAAFVVTNPTHIAIALEYAPPRVPVPAILVRAADDAAMRVREIARRHNIPLIENVPLARALYASLEPGDAIPQALYVAVAEIVALLKANGAVGA